MVSVAPALGAREVSVERERPAPKSTIQIQVQRKDRQVDLLKGTTSAHSYDRATELRTRSFSALSEPTRVSSASQLLIGGELVTARRSLSMPDERSISCEEYRDRRANSIDVRRTDHNDWQVHKGMGNANTITAGGSASVRTKERRKSFSINDWVAASSSGFSRNVANSGSQV